MVNKKQDLSEVRFAYEAPIVSITVLPSADVICTSDQDAGSGYPDNWKS
ncbi:MAG: hypothetical protein IJD77_00280 [Clostridia bacterium]|nr:hypothetical protein [Clostridia bacterium]